MDLVGSDGETWTDILNIFDDSTSTVKGYIMLQGVADGTKFIVFSVSALASPTGYKNITVAVVASSDTNPFSDADAVLLKFTRTGDKGETGSSGATVQVVNSQTGALATGTTLMNSDDTIPQNTEGDQYLSRAITPTDAGSTLYIDVVLQCESTASSGDLIAALFVDSTADAIAATQVANNSSERPVILTFRHAVSAGSTSARTYKVRAGGQSAGTFCINGYNSASSRVFGGVCSSSITITEVAP